MTKNGDKCSRCTEGKFRYHKTGTFGYNDVWSPLLRGEYDVYVCDNCGLRSYEPVRG